MARAVPPLDAETADLLTGLLDAARTAAAAGAPDDVAALMREVEQEYPAPRTGYKLARVTGLAGAIAAHTVRVHQIRADGDLPAWAQALGAVAPALNSWDWDERTQAALDLRRTFKDLTNPPADVRPARLVAAWLTHTSGQGLVPATRNLVTYAHEHASDALGAGWYATCGDRLLARLAGPLRPGRGGDDEREQRHRTRHVVRGLASTGLHTRSDLAAAARVTRATIYAWLRDT